MSLFVTQLLPPKGLAALRASGRPFLQRDSATPISRQEMLEGVRGVEALVCMLTDRVDAEVLDAAGPGLRVVANVAVGVDNLDLGAARARGVVVTNTPGVLTDATADLAMALLLAAARRIVEGDRLVREGAWRGWSATLLLGGDLAGRTLGIVGAGRIGAAVARRARGFDLRVIHHSRSEHPEIGPRVELDELLATSDFVSLHCPLTPETLHLLDARRLGLMKPTAWLVNTARGPVVDEAALVAILKARRIAGAALDVFEGEPRVHPELLTLDNVVLAPHLGSATVGTRDRMARMAIEDVLAVLEGREPRHRVV
jgi:glyoxylate reductase